MTTLDWTRVVHGRCVMLRGALARMQVSEAGASVRAVCVMCMRLPSVMISCPTKAAYRVPRRAVIPMHEPRCHGLAIDREPGNEASDSRRVTRGIHAPRCVRYDTAASCGATYDPVVNLDVQEK